MHNKTEKSPNAPYRDFAQTRRQEDAATSWSLILAVDRVLQADRARRQLAAQPAANVEGQHLDVTQAEPWFLAVGTDA